MNDSSAGSAVAPLLALVGVRKTFRQGGREIDVLRGADLEVRSGEMIALVGPSGAGKSTLLHIAGLLERPSGGRIVLQGNDCERMNGQERALLRGRLLGFVYQYHHLLPEFSALENAMLPQMLAGAGRTAARARAAELLEALGLKDRLGHRPAALSGGEQQRVAIARAVANRPSVLLADEPTGNLDRETAERVFRQFLQLVRESGIGALVATHNPALTGRMDRILEIADGRLEERQRG